MTETDQGHAELVECPHCGSGKHAMVEEYQFPPDDEGEAWKWGYHVVCSAAGLDHIPRGCGSSSGWGETPAEAIAAWNRRTPAANSYPLLAEALKAARPVIAQLIEKQINVETWGLVQRLTAIDAALAQDTRS
jgi:hypothetical protein